MKLHGVALSNYFNMVKHTVLEKGIECEFVNTRPSQEPEFLAKSPMGKVPMLETEHGFLTETNVILDFLEESFPAVRLLPTTTFGRAKVRQLMKTQELYVETPAHDLVGAIFNREIPAHVKVSSQVNALKGLAALGRPLRRPRRPAPRRCARAARARRVGPRRFQRARPPLCRRRLGRPARPAGPGAGGVGGCAARVPRARRGARNALPRPVVPPPL